MYTLKGELKALQPVQQVSDTFKKRDFVVTDASGQYAQHIQFQVVQDRCSLLDKFKVGDQVEVTFFLRGREWTNPKDNTVKYFNTLDAWKIEAAGQKAPVTTETATTEVEEEDEDLPF